MKTALWMLAMSTGVLGLSLLLVLGGSAWAALRRGALSRHRSGAESAADLLNYGVLVDDGVVLTKSGDLLAGFTYRAADALGSTDEEQNALVEALNRALAQLGSGWMVHIDAVRAPVEAYAADGAFPDPITAAIDEERRRFFRSRGVAYEGYCVLTVTYRPPAVTEARFKALLFGEGSKASAPAAIGDQHLSLFKRELDALQNRLPLKVRRLRARDVELEPGEVQGESWGVVEQDELLRFLQYCVTGLAHPIARPKAGLGAGAYLDAVIGGQDMELVGDELKVGQKYVQVVGIDGFPLVSCPGLLNHLAELPCEYRWSTRAILLDPHEGIRELEKYRRKWRQKIRGFMDQVLDNHSGPVDRHAVDMVYDAEAAISAINSGEVGPAYYTSVVVLMDEDRDQARHAAQATARVIRRLGFSGARIEDLNRMEAFLGSLPGHSAPNVRRPLMNTRDVADLIPTSSLWAGAATAPCPYYGKGAPPLMYCLTSGSTPFRLNLHDGDVGHTLMFGPTGAGKSTHLAVLAAQLRRYPGMRVFAFDKGLSLYPLAAAIAAATDGRSGLHFELGADDRSLSFAPLHDLERDSDRRWAAEWLEMLLLLNGVQPTPGQRAEIASALASMHQTGSRSMSELVMTVQDRQVSEVLRQYTSAAPLGWLLDASEDGVALSDFTVFEIEALITLDSRIALPVLTYLFRRIERSLDGRPAAILLDEAWVMLGHPAFRDKIREWLKVLRKANCFVLMATQSLSDAVRSGILDVLVESCPTKIFLPNPNARSEEGAGLYQAMGLNRRQIEVIAAATKKRDYYLVSPQGRRMYELALGPLALSLCAASGKEDIAKIRVLQAQHGPAWVGQWLSLRGVPSSALQVRA